MKQMSICILDHGCLRCIKYNTNECASCFKHQFKDMHCAMYQGICAQCEYMNEAHKEEQTWNKNI